MQFGTFTRSVLFLSGAVAIGIGGSILTFPAAFYATYGIDTVGQVSLLNELRAAGGAVLAVGFFILSGAFVVRLAPVAAGVGALIYLAYALSRGLSVLLDGAPDGGLIAVAWIELAIGAACLAVLPRRAFRKPGAQ